ncbi:MAG: DUF2304 domain-containing protein [Deltaproteobacteria bacterium]|nr:DUF2304 domain-containing protein [Deltaproteobacteria bacterium]
MTGPLMVTAALGADGLTPRQTVFATIVVVGLLVTVFELVRRRTMRIEYAWLWIITGFALFVLVFRYNWLLALTGWIGAVDSTSTLMIFSVIFLVVLAIHFSIRISQLTNRVKNLTQEAALLQLAVDDLRKERAGSGRDARPETPPEVPAERTG